jgi:hypothetical protein
VKTHWEIKETKALLLPLPKGAHKCMLSLLIGCLKFLFSELFISISA